jgi:predicted CXXCH cytochrome family protein
MKKFQITSTNNQIIPNKQIPITKLFGIWCLGIGIYLGFGIWDLGFAQVQPPRNPNSAKECAICHYRWIDTFFEFHKGSELVPYQPEMVVSKPEICFSCHDGSVVDSRARVYNDHRHKVNKPPPPDMRIPKIFPLDKNGNMQCATCHTAHGVPSEMGIEKTIFIRTSNKDSAMCRMCHSDKDGGPLMGNHPIGKIKKFKMPSRLIVLGGKQGEKKNQIICETCHTVHGSVNESFLIESARNSGLCLECHPDKNIIGPDGKRRPLHVINVKPEKVKIPKEFIKRGAKLGRNGEIICQTCHKVHNNRIEKNLLLARKDKNSTLCLTCHTDKKYITETKHNLIHTAPREKNLKGETVAEAGVCSACHLPHKPARKLPENGDVTTRLCLSCHSKGEIGEKSLPGKHSHPVDIDPFEEKPQSMFLITMAAPQGGDEIKVPLFNRYGIQDKDGRITCMTCHDPHRWRPDSTEGEIRADVEGDSTNSFLRKPSPEICRECHRDKFYIANTKHDMEKVAPEEKNILNQTPAESGICGSCHLVHGGQEEYLWARIITTKSENPAENLCISCHNQNGVGRKKTLKDYSHPLNISPFEKELTTTLPLFDKQGKLSEKGIMTCQTCHDPHRWDPVRLTTGDHSNVEGNAQNSFLRLENVPLPRLCVNCHAEQGYIVGTDHDLIYIAPKTKNLAGQLPAESGTCGVCHLVHNSKNKTRLWAQRYGPVQEGETIMSALCYSCHSKGGVAENKTIEVAGHPSQKLISNALRNNKHAIDYFPIFDKKGKYVTVGNISCPSCHNAHQWSPLAREKGPGKNIEGNATNSFLRNSSYENICIDCHGLDALFRFKYYHEPNERKGLSIGTMIR